jgi:integrase
MRNGIHRLSALAVTKANKPGSRLADGGNLYLRVGSNGGKSWVFMYSQGTRENRRQREIGLGPVHTVSLAEAREKAAELRKMMLAGDDPMASRLQRRLDQARTITFDEAAKTYIDTHKAGWKNPKHADQWQNTLDTYASPVMGRFSVASIDTELILKALRPIWESKTETAARVRGRIERILDWAAVQKYRTGENPARWKGHLEHSLAAPTKLKGTQHHAALPYSDMGSFMQQLRARDALAARMLEFAILTATRSGEVRGAVWSEIDLDKAVWLIPASRMKMKKEHRVPLSGQAVQLLEARKASASEVKDTDYIFPGPTHGKPFSDAAMSMLLKDRMQRPDVTAHGFRSTFRDWTAECTAYPREVCEMALAHAIPDAVEAAYRRGDLFEKRRKMMSEWANYCDKPLPAKTDNVVPMKGKTAA